MGPFLLGICLSAILGFSQIALLVNVYDIKYREKKLEYGLDDGSGRINWVANNKDAERQVTEFREL